MTILLSGTVLFLSFCSFLFATERYWWTPQYSQLTAKIRESKDSTSLTSYRTGPQGRQELQLKFHCKPKRGMTLELTLPGEASVTLDPKSGKTRRQSKPKVITIRDNDEDGIPDDFREEGAGDPHYKEEMTKEGFIRYRPGAQHQSISKLWEVGVGFGVNKFLHGVDSALPLR